MIYEITSLLSHDIHIPRADTFYTLTCNSNNLYPYSDHPLTLSLPLSVCVSQDMMMDDLAMSDDEDVIDSEDIDLDLELQDALEGRYTTTQP